MSYRPIHQYNPQDQYSTSVPFRGTVSSQTESQTNGNLYATTYPTHTTDKTINRFGTSPTNDQAIQMENNVPMYGPLLNLGQPSRTRSGPIPPSVGIIPSMHVRTSRPKSKQVQFASTPGSMKRVPRPGPVMIPMDNSLSVDWSTDPVAQGGSTKDYYPTAGVAARRDLETLEGNERVQVGEPVLLIPHSAARKIVTEQPTSAHVTEVDFPGSSTSEPYFQDSAIEESGLLQDLGAVLVNCAAVCPTSSLHFYFY